MEAQEKSTEERMALQRQKTKITGADLSENPSMGSVVPAPEARKKAGDPDAQSALLSGASEGGSARLRCCSRFSPPRGELARREFVWSMWNVLASASSGSSSPVSDSCTCWSRAAFACYRGK